MNTIKNAVSALKRNRGRNIFIALIMFVIISISCIALTINNTANGIAREQKAKFGSKVSIQMSQDAMNQMMQENSEGGVMLSAGTEPIDPNLLQEIAKSKYLKDTIFSSGFGADSPQLKPAKSETSSGGFSQSITSIGGGEQMKTPDFQIEGYSANQKDSILNEANRKLIDGSLPVSALDCMISDKLAKENNLKVGDTFTLTAAKYEKELPDPVDMEMVISGIYSDIPSSNSDQNIFSFDQGNQIYMLYEATMEESYHTQAYLNSTYYLNSPDDLEAFTKEARSLGLSDKYEITTDESTYHQVVGPIDSMSSMSLLFLSVVLVLGAAILILLTILNIRERNYEIGILRSLGMKKHNVILQMIMEPAILMALMLVLGSGVGSMIAQPISDTLLAQQIESANSPQSSGGMIMYSVGTMNGEEAIKEMDVAMDLTSFLQLFGVAAFLVIISGLISSIYIVKYEPMQILSERR